MAILGAKVVVAVVVAADDDFAVFHLLLPFADAHNSLVDHCTSNERYASWRAAINSPRVASICHHGNATKGVALVNRVLSLRHDKTSSRRNCAYHKENFIHARTMTS